MNKNINALLMLLMVGGFAMPTGQLFASGDSEDKKIGKSWYSSASEYCSDLYQKVTQGREYSKKRDNAIKKAKNKNDAYDAGFEDGVNAAVDQSTFDDYKEVREDLKTVSKHEGQLEEQRKEINRQQKSIEDLNKSLGFWGNLVSLTGGAAATIGGACVYQGGGLMPAPIKPMLQGSGTVALGAGIIILSVQAPTYFSELLPTSLGSWRYPIGCGIAAATGLLGLFVINKGTAGPSVE